MNLDDVGDVEDLVCMNDLIVSIVDDAPNKAHPATPLYVQRHTVQCHSHDGNVYLGYEAEYDNFDVKSTSRDLGDRSVPLSRTLRCNAWPKASALRLLPYKFPWAWRQKKEFGQNITRGYRKDTAERITCRTAW
jgi:hypothetical protein